jgi:hypothetical protein
VITKNSTEAIFTQASEATVGPELPLDFAILARMPKRCRPVISPIEFAMGALMATSMEPNMGAIESAMESKYGTNMGALWNLYGNPTSA